MSGEISYHICEFLVKNPDSGLGAVAKGINRNPKTVSTVLLSLYNSGKIKRTGEVQQYRYSCSVNPIKKGNNNSPKKTPALPVDIDPGFGRAGNARLTELLSGVRSQYVG